MSKKNSHRNSYENKEPNHLYVFYDNEKRTIHKFGVSAERINEDGTCKRMRRQLKPILPFIKLGRITLRIIMKMIPGRRRALEIEDDCVERFVEKHGSLPNGNPNHCFASHRWRKDK